MMMLVEQKEDIYICYNLICWSIEMMMFLLLRLYYIEEFSISYFNLYI